MLRYVVSQILHSVLDSFQTFDSLSMFHSFCKANQQTPHQQLFTPTQQAAHPEVSQELCCVGGFTSTVSEAENGKHRKTNVFPETFLDN